MNIDKFITENKITQIYISKSINAFKKKFTYINKNIDFNFTYDKYTDNNKNTLFFGLFYDYEINLCINHKGNKWVLWYENDCSYRHKLRITNVNKIKKLNNIYHLSSNKITSINLKRHKISFLNVDLNLMYFSKEKTKFKLITNDKIYSIANNLQYLLKDVGYDSSIILNPKNDKESINDIYIIIYHKFYSEQKHKLPDKYIFYQIEQKTSRYFNNKYFDIMNKSLSVWDFSLSNIKFYNSKIEKKDINYIPFPIYKEKIIYNENKLYDIFFYGTINPRRDAILKYLEKRYNIYYGNNIINKERDDAIKKSKIILNIHYYDKCSLETCRLNEILKYNKLILSEYPCKEDNDNFDLYSNSVVFFDIIDNRLKNINNLTKLIDFYLNEENYNNFLTNIDKEKEKIYNYTLNNVKKILI